jgi:hypothetical protein
VLLNRLLRTKVLYTVQLGIRRTSRPITQVRLRNDCFSYQTARISQTEPAGVVCGRRPCHACRTAPFWIDAQPETANVCYSIHHIRLYTPLCGSRVVILIAISIQKVWNKAFGSPRNDRRLPGRDRLVHLRGKGYISPVSRTVNPSFACTSFHESHFLSFQLVLSICSSCYEVPLCFFLPR